MGSLARSDTQKGAFPSFPLPSWATLTAGTWDNLPGGAIGSIPFVTSPTASGSGMTVFSGTITNWSGAAFSADYCPFGAMIHYGGGHASASMNHLSNAVLAWRLDTASWECVINPWYDSSKVIPAPGATLTWNTSLHWWDTISSPQQFQQANEDLAARAEYDVGIPASDHTYARMQCVPASLGGSSRGSLVVPGYAAPGDNAQQGDYFSQSNKMFKASYIHEANLSTKQWGKFCPAGPQEVASSSQNGTGRAPSCFDTRRGKLYYLGDSNGTLQSGLPVGGQYNFGICVCDTVTRTTTVCQILGVQGLFNLSGNSTALEFVPHPTDSTQDLIVHWTGTNLFGMWAKWVASLGTQQGFDSTVGVFPLTMSGSSISSGAHAGGYGFEFCPDLNAPNGAICAMDKYPGGVMPTTNKPTMFMLQVPSSLLPNRRLATWTWTSEQLTRASNPSQSQPNDWGVNESWNRMRYARTAKCFLLCDSDSLPYRMFKPTGIT